MVMVGARAMAVLCSADTGRQQHSTRFPSHAYHVKQQRIPGSGSIRVSWQTEQLLYPEAHSATNADGWSTAEHTSPGRQVAWQQSLTAERATTGS